ncbi:uncharacterized protein KNAG_0D02420 [Huiozyma naganishii CBS 8797]|uniref:Uncharacterized protein n=1 Tax=Huiozyma naganishii (strain ATCC MYA-139 / BCRC 22969 / CBS 8797 / KCTC 17520 / NBRC 10181 / NCYC 3082 / Yp74L-3) TaxID=1071383 RepID=J7RY15_HUIN7|nr:hypothetical protein KNAG_0D02420 [Kazachstania naganishii CBS 8797]CCK69992.1 hypothetical protein KNAG_0D02420 [Kazachstania naganishii CBS 8797]
MLNRKIILSQETQKKSFDIDDSCLYDPMSNVHKTNNENIQTGKAHLQITKSSSNVDFIKCPSKPFPYLIGKISLDDQLVSNYSDDRISKPAQGILNPRERFLSENTNISGMPKSSCDTESRIVGEPSKENQHSNHLITGKMQVKNKADHQVSKINKKETGKMYAGFRLDKTLPTTTSADQTTPDDNIKGLLGKDESQKSQSNSCSRSTQIVSDPTLLLNDAKTANDDGNLTPKNQKSFKPKIIYENTWNKYSTLTNTFNDGRITACPHAEEPNILQSSDNRVGTVLPIDQTNNVQSSGLPLWASSHRHAWLPPEYRGLYGKSLAAAGWIRKFFVITKERGRILRELYIKRDSKSCDSCNICMLFKDEFLAKHKILVSLGRDVQRRLPVISHLIQRRDEAIHSRIILLSGKQLWTATALERTLIKYERLNARIVTILEELYRVQTLVMTNIWDIIQIMDENLLLLKSYR